MEVTARPSGTARLAGPHRRGRGPALSRLLVRGALAVVVCAVAPEAASSQQSAASRKTLRVATSGDYAPFSQAAPGRASHDLTDASGTEMAAGPAGAADDAALEGFDIELAKSFARDRGYRLELVRFRWPDLAGELAAGNFDVAMSGVTIGPGRSIAGRFSVPVAATHAVALSWKGSGATNERELDRPGRRVAVNAGGHLERVARSALHHASVLPLADNDAVYMAMLDRTFDAVITDNLEAKVWGSGAKDIVRIGPLSDDRKACLLPADRGQLAAELDVWLLAREKDGTLARLRNRYFAGGANADDAGTATAEPLAALVSAIAERLDLMPMVYAAKKRAGRPIEDKEREAAVIDGATGAVEAALAAGAASAPPDPSAVRSLFEALIAAGKDVQQQLADADARRRPGVVHRRQPGKSSSDAGDLEPRAGVGDAAGDVREDGMAGDTAAPSANDAAVPAKQAQPPSAPVRRGERVYDLEAELRPAISRIGEKIARILVAMDEPILAKKAQAQFVAVLATRGVRNQSIEALTAAVVTISTRRSSR